MKRFLDPKTKEDVVWLSVDEYVVETKEKSLRTVLGSCVSLILYAPNTNYFGLNHYLNSDSGKILNEKLFLELKQKVGRNQIFAQIIGGSSSQSSFFKIGELNLNHAREFCEEHKIVVKKIEGGGDSGRTIGVSFDGVHLKVSSVLHSKNNDSFGEQKLDKSVLTESSQKAFDTIKKMMEKNKS